MRTALLFFLLSLPAQAGTWTEASNQIAHDYAESDGALFPERASATGLNQFDGKAFTMEKDQDARELALIRDWSARLQSEEAQATDENLRLDMRILRDHLDLRRGELELNEKFGVVSFWPGTRFVMESLLNLVNDQSPPERRRKAAERFHLYVNGDDKHPPLLTSFQNRSLSEEIRFQKKRLMPVRMEVEQYLAESPSFVAGVRQALVKSGATGWEGDFALFQQEAAAYDETLRTHLLPLARRDYRLPKELYAHTLRMRGIEASPDELIRSAHAGYKSLYQEFRKAARDVAKEEGWKGNEPAQVIARLKRRQVLKPEEVKPLFESADHALEEIIRREKLVTLPSEPLRIRVAGDAESVANPVPYLDEPPLVGNHGQRPTFVVPSFASGRGVLDDFSFPAAALVLTAHEGRPGHDLQYSSMIDRGVSVIRARYAFNNANVEGWGLYAEEMMYPYLPRPAQLVALQFRLLRMARAFFDPEIQLGKVRPADVARFLTRELGVSQRLAGLEVRRFEFENPGQAPSYFYGLERLEGARRRIAGSMGPRFNDRCFHDGVLSLGMVPVGLIGPELEKSLRCAPTKAQAAQEHPLDKALN